MGDSMYTRKWCTTSTSMAHFERKYKKLSQDIRFSSKHYSHSVPNPTQQHKLPET